MAELQIEQRIAGLVAIAKEVKVCPKCPLAEGRTNAVPGAGPANAEIMFIGEGPGQNEDEKGLPFVGASGRFLEELLASIGMTRREAFITNVVKCRPPGNRDPQPDEVLTCTQNYLYKQIELVNPKVIATLGRYSMALFLPGAKISAIHGQPKFADGRAYLPMFHPAAVLRNPGLRGEAFADFAKLPGLVAEIKQRGETTSTPIPLTKSNTPDDPPKNSPEQLSLF